MEFYLCSAAQNTFFFIEESQLQASLLPDKLKLLSHPQLAQTLCQNYGSRGADGFVIVKKVLGSTEIDFEWEFYNRDGSSAEMCGNASRCMAFYVKEFLKFNKPELKFKTLAGTILVKYVGPKNYSVRMTEPKLVELWNEMTVNENEKYQYCLINSGVPHAIIEVQDMSQNFLLPIVKHFRYIKEFGTAGANVSFYKSSEGQVNAITFERGVENFTASCGTGVVAVALALFNKKNYNGNYRVEIQTPGGQLLVEKDSTGSFCWLTGEAELLEVVTAY